MRVTIIDVAKLANTSTASVSYYLNGRLNKLGKDTQQRIADAIRETGYVPNAQAQALTGKSAHVIGLIILDNTNIWHGQIQAGLDKVMRSSGYQIITCATHFDKDVEQASIEKLLALGVDGFLVQPTTNFKAINERLKRTGKPVVYFDSELLDFETSWVKTNLYDGIYSAIQECCKRRYQDFISIMSNSTGQRTRIERANAFNEALAANNIEPKETIIIHHGSPTAEELYQQIVNTISPNKKTLIFVHNQWALSRVYQALEPVRDYMPSQIGLLGLNCANWTELTVPSISTIIEPIYEEGMLMGQMLIDQLTGERTTPRQEILSCQTRWLESTL